MSSGDRAAAWVALVLGLGAAVVGVGMVLSFFFIPVGIPLLGYGWARLRWANRSLRLNRMERSDYVLNIAVGMIALLICIVLAIALWPGQPVGYALGGAFAATETALVVAASRKVAM